MKFDVAVHLWDSQQAAPEGPQAKSARGNGPSWIKGADPDSQSFTSTSGAAGRQSRPKVILASITACFDVKYHSLL